ncbi:phosphoglycerate kinase [Lysobacter sp. 2RAB21]
MSIVRMTDLDLAGKRVLIREDLNVPIDDGRITSELRILAALDAVAAGHRGATPAQVALAWLIARPSITAPIASATSVAQLQELIAAARLSLSADEIAALDAASAGG